MTTKPLLTVEEAAFVEGLRDAAKKLTVSGYAPAFVSNYVQAADLITRLAEENERKDEALRQAAKRFREYVLIHQGKIEPKHDFVPADLREKIDRNREMAELCESALKGEIR